MPWKRLGIQIAAKRMRKNVRIFGHIFLERPLDDAENLMMKNVKRLTSCSTRPIAAGDRQTTHIHVSNSKIK